MKPKMFTTKEDSGKRYRDIHESRNIVRLDWPDGKKMTMHVVHAEDLEDDFFEEFADAVQYQFEDDVEPLLEDAVCLCAGAAIDVTFCNWVPKFVHGRLTRRDVTIEWEAYLVKFETIQAEWETFDVAHYSVNIGD